MRVCYHSRSVASIIASNRNRWVCVPEKWSMIDGVSLALLSTLGFLFVDGGLTEDRRESRISQTDTGFWRFGSFTRVVLATS